MGKVKSGQGAGWGSRAPELALAAILVATAALRWRVLDVPLERDEGEYAYGGLLLLDGILPYEQMYTMKLPGIHAVYAVLLAVFERSPSGIHLGLLLANAATIVLLFFLVRRTLGGLEAVAAAASLALLSVSWSVQGVFANAEHFVLVAGLAGLLVLVRGGGTPRAGALVGAGLLLGTAFVIKQHGIVFLAMGTVYLVAHREAGGLGAAGRRVAILCAAAAVPLAVLFVVVASAGFLETAWFWNVTYAGTYAREVALSETLQLLGFRVRNIFWAAPALWCLVAAGAVAACFDPRVRARWSFFLPFVALSIAAVLPGFYFRPHYFLFAMPAASVLVGIAIGRIAGPGKSPTRRVRASQALAVAILVAGCAQALFAQRTFFFQMTTHQLVRAVYGPNPFPESVEIGRWIRNNTEPGDTVAVLGSEPQLFFYSGRRSATRYIYAYAVVENHPFAKQMQQEMMAEIEAAKPKILVFVRSNLSWLRRDGAPRDINRWFRDYKKDYDLVVLADLRDSELRLFRGSLLASFEKLPKPAVEVYTRRPEPES